MVDINKKRMCGCGRSPTGECIGWHSLSIAEYRQREKEFKQKKFVEKAKKHIQEKKNGNSTS
jgi:hypothetical protein